MDEWGKSITGELLERWPKKPGGEPETPVFLCNCKSNDMDAELRMNMLEAYGVPCLRLYPGDGTFGRVVLGMSGQGVDIYVPESLAEDAKALCEEDSNGEV